MAAAAPEPEADAASRVWVDGSGLAGPEVAEALVGRRVDILGTGQGTVTGYIRNKMSSNIFVVMVESKDSVHPVETKIALQRHKHNDARFKVLEELPAGHPPWKYASDPTGPPMRGWGETGQLSPSEQKTASTIGEMLGADPATAPDGEELLRFCRARCVTARYCALLLPAAD